VPGQTLEERLANLEAWGYQGIQVQRPTLQMGIPALKAALATGSVRVCTFRGGGGLLAGDEETRQAAVEQIKEGLHRTVEVGAPIASVGTIRMQPEIAPPPPPKTLIELEREILIEGLAQIAPTAERLGLTCIMEPLNRYESHFLNRLEQGAEICRAVGSPSIKIMADFFHMNIEEADIGWAIEEVADYIAYVHLADSNRFQPGAGHLDFRPGLAALKRIGYEGFMTLECKVMGEDKGKALVEAARYIRRIWDEL
jgi:sugar phosphate isomerase/epimerase